MSKIKVIFHIDELSKWSLVIANTRNLLSEMKDDLAEVEILANSEAVLFYKKDDSSLKKQVLELVNQNVKFSACKNSMRTFNLNQNVLEEYVVPVNSGVAHLAYQQVNGFVYIKP